MTWLESKQLWLGSRLRVINRFQHSVFGIIIVRIRSRVMFRVRLGVRVVVRCVVIVSVMVSVRILFQL